MTRHRTERIEPLPAELAELLPARIHSAYRVSDAATGELLGYAWQSLDHSGWWWAPKPDSLRPARATSLAVAIGSMRSLWGLT